MTKKLILVLAIALLFSPVPFNSIVWAQDNDSEEVELELEEEEVFSDDSGDSDDSSEEEEFGADDSEGEDDEELADDEDFEDEEELAETDDELEEEDFDEEEEELAEEKVEKEEPTAEEGDEGGELEALSDEEIQEDQEEDEAFQAQLAEEEEAAEPSKVQEESLEQPEENIAYQTFEDSGPDLEYEAQLHNIYLNFHNAPTAEEEWSMLLVGRETEIYEIQNGDTLWGISKLFFGDGNYWPKIWSLNSKITNPHLISKGHSIGFIMGTESEAPSFTVTEGDGENLKAPPEEPTVVAETAESEGAKEEQDEGPEIPEPEKISAPVIKVLPPSLPMWQSQRRRDEYSASGISVVPRKISQMVPKVTLNSYIDSEFPEKVGELVEVETGYKVASLYQYVYLKLDPGVGRVGDKFLVVQRQGKIIVPPGIKTEGDEFQYQVQGEVKLVDVTKMDRAGSDDKSEHFRALVTKMVEPVMSGAFLVQGKVSSHDVTMEGARSRVVAQIIGGALARNVRLFTTGSLAFLNRGSLDGLADGQILAIRENRKLRKSHSMVLENLRPVGWLKVIRTAQKYATAVVVQAWDDVKAGDYTGLGEMLPRVKSGAMVAEAEHEKSMIDEIEEDESDEEEDIEADLDEGTMEAEADVDSDESEYYEEDVEEELEESSEDEDEELDDEDLEEEI